jgi:hypothetical protein
MMLFNKDSAIQSSSRRFCTVCKSEKSDPLQRSGRRDILSGRPTVKSIIRPDDENFLSEPSSALRSFELFQIASVQTASIRTFQQHIRMPLSVRSAMGFLSKTQIWEAAATVRTMWIPFWTRSSIRQVVHSKFRRPDNGLRSSDVRASYMESACIRSTVPKTDVMFWTLEALIWKLPAAKVRRPGRRGNTVQTQFNLEKNFCEIWKADRTVICPDASCLPSGQRLDISSQTLIWTCSLWIEVLSLRIVRIRYWIP